MLIDRIRITRSCSKQGGGGGGGGGGLFERPMISAQAIRHLRSTRPFLSSFYAIRLLPLRLSILPISDSSRVNHVWCSTTAVPITRIYQSCCYFASLLCALCPTRMVLKPGRYLPSDCFQSHPEACSCPLCDMSFLCLLHRYGVPREPSSPVRHPMILALPAGNVTAASVPLHV